MDIVATSVENAPGHLKSYMRTMAGLDNIPRKEKQFRNFTANSLNLRGKNEAIVGEIWELLKTERDKRQEAKEKQQLQHQEQKKNTDSQKKSDKEGNFSEKLDENPKTVESNSLSAKNDKSNDSVESPPEIDPKTVQKAMKKALKHAPNQSMKLKELRKLLGEKLGLPKSAKKRLKKLLQDAPETSKKAKIKVNGKMITLI